MEAHHSRRHRPPRPCPQTQSVQDCNGGPITVGGTGGGDGWTAGDQWGFLAPPGGPSSGNPWGGIDTWGIRQPIKSPIPNIFGQNEWGLLRTSDGSTVYRKAGKDQQEYMKIQLSDVTLFSYHPGSGDSGFIGGTDTRGMVPFHGRQVSGNSLVPAQTASGCRNPSSEPAVTMPANPLLPAFPWVGETLPYTGPPEPLEETSGGGPCHCARVNVVCPNCWFCSRGPTGNCSCFPCIGREADDPEAWTID